MSEESLTDFITGIGADSHLRVETDLGDGFVRLRSEEAERRQAVHDIRTSEDALIELLRNSRDAHARSIFVATSKSSDGERFMAVIDDGDGIPNHMHELIFEPRVTSKLDSMHIDKWGVHGRGMALYSIKTNAKTALVQTSQVGKGTALTATFDLKTISEKADQSTFPRFSMMDGQRISVSGPKNLLRTACEFSWEHRDYLQVYMGSAVEIAATLYEYGVATLSVVDRTFAKNTDDVPLVKRLALAADEVTFCEVAETLGLQFSTRSARRILDGDIKPLEPLWDLVQRSLLSQLAPVNNDAKAKPRKSSSAHAIKMSKEDIADFSAQIKDSFGDIARSYYLEPDVEPTVKVHAGAIVVHIPLVEQE